MGGCWGKLSSMKEMLNQHGFKYMTETVASENNVINGGTAIGKMILQNKMLLGIVCSVGLNGQLRDHSTLAHTVPTTIEP